MAKRISVVAGRAGTPHHMCDGCRSMLQVGDLYVNVDVLDECLVLCRQCVFDLDTSINDFMRKEDKASA